MMVTRWGLSEELGTVSYGENQDEVFLGMSVSRTQNASEATVQKIDSEIRRLVEEGYNEATKILTEKRADLESSGQGPARVRDAERRRDHRPAEGQEAEPRVGAGADHAAHLGGAAGRQAAPASRSGCRSGAAAAGVTPFRPWPALPANHSCKSSASSRAFAFLWAARPTAYDDIVGKLPADVTIVSRLKAPLDMVHLFATQAAGLAGRLRSYRDRHRARRHDVGVMAEEGERGRDRSERRRGARRRRLPLGLVDIKVCAIDDDLVGAEIRDSEARADGLECRHPSAASNRACCSAEARANKKGRVSMRLCHRRCRAWRARYPWPGPRRQTPPRCAASPRPKSGSARPCPIAARFRRSARSARARSAISR